MRSNHGSPYPALCALAFVAASAPVAATPAPAAEPLVPGFLRLSIEDPRGALVRGEELLAAPPARDRPEIRRELLNRMARAAILLSDRPALDALVLRLDELGRKENDPTARAFARFLRAITLAEGGLPEEALAEATGAGAELTALGTDLARAQAAAELCDVAIRMPRADLARLHCDTARRAWTELDDPFQLGRADNYLALVAAEEGRYDEAIRLALRSKREFDRAGLPSLVVMVDDNLAGYYLETGDAARALELSRGALALELATGKAVHAINSRKHIAEASSRLGRHDEALAEIARAIADALRLDYRAALADLYENQSVVAARAGRIELAIESSRLSREAVREQLTQSRERAMAEMQERYQALERQHQIERLDQANRVNALELAANSATLERQRIAIAGGVLGLAALAIFSTVLLRLLRAVRRRERELETLSRTDSLTQVANRRAFLAELEAALAAARRDGRTAALLVLDADHFKAINDTHGHQAGDLALVEIARRTRAQIRAGDTVGRIGGEEFGVVLPGLTLEQAAERAESIRRAVAAEPLRIDDDRSVALSVSLGVAVPSGTAPAAGVDDWLAAADGALYDAKRNGRNRVELSAAKP